MSDQTRLRSATQYGPPKGGQYQFFFHRLIQMPAHNQPRPQVFRQLLVRYGCRQSMSRADDPYDNAFAESYWSRLKAELIEGGAFLSLADARLEIGEYIDNYYNTIRLHSALSYLSPMQFEAQTKR